MIISPKPRSSYPTLFDPYEYHYPIEIQSSKENETLLSLLSVDRTVDKHKEDGVMNELYEVDLSVSTAPKINDTSLVKDKNSLLLELLLIDQLVDNQQQDIGVSLYDPYTKKEISAYSRNYQYITDCTTLSSRTFQSLLQTDETIDQSKKQQDDSDYSILDLLHVDEEVDGYKKKHDSVYVIMEEIYNVDLEIANASHSAYDREVEDILNELVKVDKEIEYNKMQSNPVTFITLDILFNDRLIDTSKNSSAAQMLIHEEDKEDVIHYVYDARVLKGYNYFLAVESKCDIEDGHNPILLDLWDVDYEMSNKQIVNSDLYKAFQVIYGIDLWVDKQHQKHVSPADKTTKVVYDDLDSDILDLLDVDNFVAGYNQTGMNKTYENALYDLLNVDNEIDLHHKGFIAENHTTIIYPKQTLHGTTPATMTYETDDNIKALLKVDQEIDGCKGKSTEDVYLDALEELYNVDQEIEFSSTAKHSRDYAMKTHDRKIQDVNDTNNIDTSATKRSIFTGQEKQMALSHSTEMSAHPKNYDDYCGDSSASKKKKKHGLKKLKGKNICVIS